MQPPKQRAAVFHSLRLVVLVLGMFGFGYAMVPLYNALCQVTGLNGKVRNTASAAPTEDAVDRTRLVTVQFVTTVNGGRVWEFRPEQTQVRVHPGELTTVKFYARNLEDAAVVGQAVPNVAPWEAAKHLHKTECFCFNNQPFLAMEEKHMPVRFVVDRDLPSTVDTVTLSYTFFDVTQAAGERSTQAPRS